MFTFPERKWYLLILFSNRTYVFQAGVAIPDTVVAEFDNMKLKKTYGFIIFRLSDDRRSVIVDKTGDVRAQDSDSVETLTKKFADFVSLLPPNDCRYGVYDFVYQHEGAPRSKIIFMNWYGTNLVI